MEAALMETFHSLAITDPAALIFGHAPKPVTTRRGMVIGGGRVYPELNFTLPAIEVADATFPRVRKHYEEIVTGALKRAAELGSEGVVLEFETLPPMTARPEWGIELCQVLLDGMEEAHAKTGLKSALRMTPNDNREMVRPPLMRQGQYWENMLLTFDRCAELGADFLSIESVGGKEVHDEALTFCNLQQVIFALCVLGVRDMEFLWTHIAGIARRRGVHAAGDTACGFGNTAMVLAEQGMIPRVFAAVVRAVTAVRSLVAYSCGAVGPGKDCGYENPILKAITGCPMSMEGKTAACAHLSPLGNIAAATCDLWSNESVQNIRLLADMAPTCYLEQLEYDCRLFNQALADGPQGARLLQKWLVQSDAGRDPQALILAPENVIALASTIVAAPGPYAAGKAVALNAIEILRTGYREGRVRILDRELPYLDLMEAAVAELPEGEDTFIASMMGQVDTSKFVPAEYGL
jgi:methanol--5-hydroxybenzimidazolylcobamide Co-methyltransferase